MIRKILISILLVFTIFVSFSEEVKALDINVHGLLAQGFIYTDTYNYLVSDSLNGSYQFNEAAINFTTDIDKLSLGLQLMSKDLGDLYNNEIRLDWARASYLFNTGFKLNCGRIKIGMGLYGEARDLDSSTFIILPQGVYNKNIEEYYVSMNGIGFSGFADTDFMGSFSYFAQTGLKQFELDGGIAKLYRGDLPPGVEFLSIDSDQLHNAGLVWETPLPGLRFAYYVNYTDLKVQATNFDVGIVFNDVILDSYYCLTETRSIEFTWNDLVIAAELWTNRLKTESTFQEAFDPFGNPATDPFGNPIRDFRDEIRNMEGYYVSISYGISDKWAVATAYSVIYPFVNDRDGARRIANGTIGYDHQAWQKDLTLAVRYDVTNNWNVKVEYHHIDGTAWLAWMDNLFLTDGFEDDTFSVVAVKMSYTF